MKLGTVLLFLIFNSCRLANSNSMKNDMRKNDTFSRTSIVPNVNNGASNVSTTNFSKVSPPVVMLTEEIDPILESDRILIESWRDTLLAANSGLGSLLRNAIPFFIRKTSKATMTAECQGSFLEMIIAIQKMEAWAMKMIDASAKIPSGITQGTLSHLGDYDLCLSIVIKEARVRNDKVAGKYCLVVMSPIMPQKIQLDFVNLTGPNTIFSDFQNKVHLLDALKVRLGMCVPSTCNKEDLRSLLSSVTEGFPFEMQIPNCDIKEDIQLSWEQLAVLSVFGLLLIVLVLATGVDSIFQSSDQKLYSGILSILVHFSLYTNGKKFLNTKMNTPRLGSLNGIKVLTIVWILLAHTYMHSIRFSMNRSANIIEMVKDPFFGTIYNSYCSVDTFFVISGFLVSYLSMKYMDITKGRLNVIGFWFRRIWRLLPSVGFVLGAVILLPLVGSGPIWHEVVTREVEVCQRTWWATLLFINSWFDYFDMCLVNTWFIANDIHYYMLSPFLIMLFYRKPNLGIILSSALILTNVIISIAMVVVYDLRAFFPITMEELRNFKDLLQMNYFKPYCHMGPYNMGFLLGYVFFKNSEIHLKKIYVILGWITSAVLSLAILMGAWEWASGKKPTLVEMIAYHSLHRIGWSVSICWILFACSYGYGGFVNTLLSWKVFIPLSRLVYTVFLIQMPIQWVQVGSKKQTVPLEHVQIIYEFFGNLLVTLGISLVVYLSVEAPFASLDRLIFGPLSDKSRRLSLKLIENVAKLPPLDEKSIKVEVENSPKTDETIVIVSKHPPHPDSLRHRTRSIEEFKDKLSASLATPEKEPNTDNDDKK